MEYKIISILYSASLFRHFKHSFIVNAHKQCIQNITHIQKQRIKMWLWEKKKRRRLSVDENDGREGREMGGVPR